MKLSIAMIVKNEEKNIERTLIPLKELCEYIDGEIIIVDTGSTDNTIKIAKKYTDNIYNNKWCDDFSQMRNISIDYCNGEWILIVDADEVLYDVKELAELINNNIIDEYNGAFIKIINFNESVEESLANGYVSPMLRLLKKQYARYQGKIHEQPMFVEPLMNSEIRFIHYGYDTSNSELMEYKFQRNLKLLFEDLGNNENDIYTNFQISSSYSMHGDIKLAYKYIKLAYKQARNKIKNYIYVLDEYCAILYRMGLNTELIEKTKEGIRLCKDFVDFYFYLGEGYNNSNNPSKAIEIYNIYLEKLKKEKEFFNITLAIRTIGFKDNVLYNIALNYYKLKKYNSCLKYLKDINKKEIITGKIIFLIRVIFEGELYNRINTINDYVDKDNYEVLLSYIQKECTLENIEVIMNNNPEQSVKEILEIIKSFKENNTISNSYKDKIKEIIKRNDRIYTIYLYYLIKYDINEIDEFLSYGKEKIEIALKKICLEYYEINEIFIRNLDLINNIETKIVIEEALIYARKTDKNKRRKLFLDYIADKYMYIIYLYNEEIVKLKSYLLSNEERCIIELKNALSYKYSDRLMYIKLIKKTLNVEQKYTDYIKILIDEINMSDQNTNKEIVSLIPQLKININYLIENDKYQEAYDTINDTLQIIQYDFELMALKYSLLKKFNYFEEAKECFRELILYGETNKVIHFISEYYEI